MWTMPHARAHIFFVFTLSFVLYLQRGRGEAEAKAHLVGTILPTIVQDVLVNWQQRDHLDPADSRTLPVMLEIVFSIDALPPQEESFINELCNTSSPDTAMCKFVRELARFCGLNPRLGTEFAGVTKKLISAECQFYSDAQLQELCRWARRERTRASLREIDEEDRRTDSSFSGRVSIDAGSDDDPVRGTREELIAYLCRMEVILDFQRLAQQTGAVRSFPNG